ncbi:hypothetical protein TWF696_003393 [Orbilia brochopaga]|uniref:Uncharacterized protein n=1 Tax=Orbilia brochopaga TaxID=3140254 RepID=A0AAV9TY72_9PEZI
MRSSVAHPLVLWLLARTSSAFLLEIVNDLAGSPSNWQLCRASASFTPDDESVFGIDPVETTCEAQGGVPDWTWLHPPGPQFNVYDELSEAVPDDPRTFYLGADGPLEGQNVYFPQAPIIYLDGLVKQQLQLGTSPSTRRIPVSWRLHRHDNLVEVTANDQPEPGDRIRFWGHEYLTQSDERALAINLATPTNPKLPLYRVNKDAVQDPKNPQVYFRVQTKENFDSMVALERGLRREREAIENLKPGRILSNLWGKAKNTVASAREKVANQVKTVTEAGIARITGSNSNPRLHIHPEPEQYEEEKWESAEPDPAEQGGFYYGQGPLQNAINQNYIPEAQAQAQAQAGPRFERFEVETVKKGPNNRNQ